MLQNHVATWSFQSLEAPSAFKLPRYGVLGPEGDFWTGIASECAVIYPPLQTSVISQPCEEAECAYNNRCFEVMKEILVEALTNILFDLDTESLMKQVRVVQGTDDAREFHDLLNMAKVHGKPKAVYAECFIEAKGDATVQIEGITFTSLTLRRSLDTVERVFPFVVACGHEIDKTIPVKGDFLKEFWRDTVKESLLMSAHKYLCDYLHRKFRLSKTAIMSPGSGDVTVWPIGLPCNRDEPRA